MKTTLSKKPSLSPSLDRAPNIAILFFACSRKILFDSANASQEAVSTTAASLYKGLEEEAVVLDRQHWRDAALDRCHAGHAGLGHAVCDVVGGFGGADDDNV